MWTGRLDIHNFAHQGGLSQEMRWTPPSIFGLLLALSALLLASGASAAEPCSTLQSRVVRGGGQASGLFVLDAETGRVLCRRAPSRRFSLASNMKLFTTATAIARLGPETRIPTKVEASGSVDDRGVLDGSLYLVGGGDPALGTPSFYDRFLGGLGTNLYALKGQIRTAGIRAVRGRMYADDTIFDRLRGVSDSGYATSPYIGPLSGLAFDSGYSSSSATSFASDPARLAATKLVRSLDAAGIDVRSQVALRKAPPDAEQVAVVRSPSIARLAAATNVPSNNYYAETLIKLLGARFGTSGSTAAGAAVVAQYARSEGSYVHAVDGSGLTRSGKASTGQVARFLRAVRAEPYGEDFIDSLAVAGREGTVADRMDDTAAAGRCRVKTGTLTGVSALSGYCLNRSGRTMIFSILMNGVRDLGLAHLEQDRIAAAVAGY
jgi:D-alanyl-D-alanine carboxypeptidase/D-alanyl-D-alanine-endopeptidase (penicillin-binding protein 4)